MNQQTISTLVGQRFHEWLAFISSQIGTEPFQAVVQNWLYYPDPLLENKVRLQAFIEALVKYIIELEKAPDPQPLPKPVTLYAKGVNLDVV